MVSTELLLTAVMMAVLLHPGLAQEAGDCMSKALEAHNRYRKLHGADDLNWDDALAKAAQEWASQLALAGCPQGGHRSGENTYYPGIWDSKDCGAATEVWYTLGKAKYSFTTTPWTTNGPQLPDIGVFTQVVWKGSKFLGCALAEKKDGFGGMPACSVVVCRYDPPGNIETDEQFLLNVGNLPSDGVIAPGPSSNVDQVRCQEDALTAHNEFRAQRNSPVMTWDADLAQRAQDQANTLASNNYCTVYNDLWPGVNKWTTESDQIADVCKTATNNWYLGIADYPFGGMTDDFWTYRLSEYAQLIWKDSTKLGCGIAQGSSRCIVVVCHYDPPGDTTDKVSFTRNVAIF